MNQSNNIIYDAEFDENLFGEAFQMPTRLGRTKRNTRLSQSSDVENYRGQSDRTDFYSFEDDFVAKFPKIYNQKSEIQILYSSLTDFDEEPHLITLNQLLQLANDKRKIFWANIFAPSQEDIELIRNEFKIHLLTIDGIMTNSTREKLEEFSHYLYVVYRERQNILNSNTFRNVNINLLIFENFILTFHNEPIHNLVSVVYNLTFRLENEVRPDWILYKFMDCIADNFIILVRAIQSDVIVIDDLIEKMVGSLSQEDLMMRIGLARRRQGDLRDALIDKRDILITLTGEKNFKVISNSIKVYLRDVIDHIVLSLQRLELAGELLEYSNNTFLTMVELDLNKSSNEVNHVMRRITAITLLFIPPAVITGLWGMNVPVPGGTTPTPAGYSWFLIITFGIVLWVLIAGIIFRWRRWL